MRRLNTGRRKGHIDWLGIGYKKDCIFRKNRNCEKDNTTFCSPNALKEPRRGGQKNKFKDK